MAEKNTYIIRRVAHFAVNAQLAQTFTRSTTTSRPLEQSKSHTHMKRCQTTIYTQSHVCLAHHTTSRASKCPHIV